MSCIHRFVVLRYLKMVCSSNGFLCILSEVSYLCYLFNREKSWFSIEARKIFSVSILSQLSKFVMMGDPISEILYY